MICNCQILLQKYLLGVYIFIFYHNIKLNLIHYLLIDAWIYICSIALNMKNRKQLKKNGALNVNITNRFWLIKLLRMYLIILKIIINWCCLCHVFICGWRGEDDGVMDFSTMKIRNLKTSVKSYKWVYPISI